MAGCSGVRWAILILMPVWVAAIFVSLVYNLVRGNVPQGFQQTIGGGYRTVADSIWSNVARGTYYVESKFGSSTLTPAQRITQQGLGDAYVVERWGYDWVSRIGATIGNTLGIGYSETTSPSSK